MSTSTKNINFRPYQIVGFIVRVKDMLLPKAWDHPAGAGFVVAVFLAELVEHELLLFRRAVEIKRDERHQENPAGKPVGQQQALSNRPEHVGGVHRVADVSVNTVRNQRLLRLNAQRRRPVTTQIDVRTPQKNYRSGEDNCAYPAQPARQVVIGEGEPWSKEID